MKQIQQHRRQIYAMTKHSNQSGQILILVFVALGVLLFTVLFVVGGSITFFNNAQYNYQAEQAMATAEGGIDKALASLNATWGSYTGEDETLLGDGSYSVILEDKTSGIKVLTVTGYIPSKSNPKVKRTLSIQVAGVSSVYTLVKGTYQVK